MDRKSILHRRGAEKCEKNLHMLYPMQAHARYGEQQAYKAQ